MLKGVAALALVLAATPLLGAPGGLPKIAFPETKKDAGTVAKGNAFELTFAFRNEGTADLQLSDVRPSCGCTVAEFDRVVRPGAGGKVKLKVETKSFSGPITKTALVLSNDPGSPQTTLFVTVNVKPWVDVLPSGYLRVEGLEGETTSGNAVLASDEAGFSPTSPEPPSPGLSAALAPVPENERISGKGAHQWRLTLRTGPETTEGLLGGYVKVTTGLSQQPVIEVPVAGFVRPTVSVSSGSVNFQNFNTEGDDPVRREVLLTCNDPKAEAFAVTKAEVTVPNIAVTVVPVEKTKVKVVLIVDKKIRKGPIEGTLVIQTNVRLKPEIRLPLKGTVLTR